jgi:hypothetical protein
MNRQFNIRVSANGPNNCWYWEVALASGQMLARGLADSQLAANDHATTAMYDWQRGQPNPNLSMG